MSVLIVGVVGLLCGYVIDLLWGRFYTGEQIIRPLHRCAECKTPSKPLYLLPFGGLLWPFLGQLAGYVAWLFLSLMVWSVETFGALPGAARCVVY